MRHTARGVVVAAVLVVAVACGDSEEAGPATGGATTVPATGTTATTPETAAASSVRPVSSIGTSIVHTATVAPHPADTMVVPSSEMATLRALV